MKETIENKILKVKVVVKDVITQADLEAYQSIFWKMPTDTPALSRSANVQAAQQSGWIEVYINDKRIDESQATDVGQMDPRAVMFISERINTLYLEFTTIPKN